MFERFTPTARAAVTAAVEAAEQRGDRHVGTEHLLLGLSRSEAPAVVTILNEHGVDHDRAWSALQEEERAALAAVGIDIAAVGEAGSHPSSRPRPRRRLRYPAHVPFTDGAKRVLEAALDEARDLSQRHLGAEHVLLALTARPATDPGMRLLTRLDIDPLSLRDEVRERTKHVA